MDSTRSPWREIEAFGAPGSPDDPTTGRGERLGVPVVAGLAAVAAALGVAAFLLGTGGVSGVVELETAADGFEPRTERAGRVPAAGEEIVVHVAGAVLHPGVYRLPPGARVTDALAAAGGYGPRVDAARTATVLNLAAPLADGERILVPSRDEPPPEEPAGGGGGGTGAGSGATSSLVDLNRATAAELEALPGIGPVTAGKIIVAREEQPFSGVDDLRSRKLVGPATFEKVRQLVTVR